MSNRGNGSDAAFLSEVPVEGGKPFGSTSSESSGSESSDDRDTASVTANSGSGDEDNGGDAVPATSGSQANPDRSDPGVDGLFDSSIVETKDAGNDRTTDLHPTGPVNASGVIGFASVAGYGVKGTNGAGTNGEVSTVYNFSEFVAAVSDNVPRTIEVSGTIITDGSKMVDVGSNKTVIGLESNASIDGFGLDINGWTNTEIEAFGTDTCHPDSYDSFSHVSNVIVQNLVFKNSPDDSINVQCYSHHIWIDHNTFYPAGDGSVDIKRGSDLVTVSWNRLISTDKSMLLGHSKDNGEQDRGFLRTTYHHNWFDGIATRAPRVRFGFAHVYNNYLNSTDYFLGLGIEASIYAEGNYVERSKTITQTFSESVNYHLTWTETNFFDETTISRAQDSSKTRQDWLDEDGSVSSPTEYRYTPDPVQQILLLKDSAGAS